MQDETVPYGMVNQENVQQAIIEPMKLLRHITIVLLLLSPYEGNSQDSESIIYYGTDHFLLEGTTIADSLKENLYDRLPASYKEKVREPVWDLSKCSAGLSIRFLSNTSTLRVKWTVLNDLQMNHMAETGIKGIDLYYNNNGQWQYLNTARPKDVTSDYILIEHMAPDMREYKMYLPLYDGIVDLAVGIDSNSVMIKPELNTQKPIVFYGTSITQGGCASRPGMVHTNIISRKLHRDCINYGFSGNGRMEPVIVELISEIDPEFYVIECLPNMLTTELIIERTIPLVETIRAKRPETPILLVDNFIYEPSALNLQMDNDLRQLNEALQGEFNKLIQQGVKHLYYISSAGATGRDHEGTVDGVHFTDLGFIRYADFLIHQFVDLDLITSEE